MTATNVTPAEADAGLINTLGAKWAGPTITFSIPGAGASWVGGYGTAEPTDPNYGTLDATQAANFRLVMAIWDSYIAPSIVEVSDSTPGQIRIAFTDVTARKGSGVGAYAYGPSTGSEFPEAGDIWVDETYKPNPFSQQSFGFELLLHESGHSLGLKHPFESPTLPAGYDSKTYTVMSYTAEDNFYTFSGGGGFINVSYQGTVDFTPMVLDILAIQDHYGADTATGAGNTTYSFTDTSLNGRQAIYDVSGTDTIDLSALSRGSNVDLRQGAYSDIDYYSVADQEEDLVAVYGEGLRSFIHNTLNDPSRPAYEWERNVGIAFSTIIENVIGSGSADTIAGNAAANRIDGRGGADLMIGRAGSDIYFVDNLGDRVLEAANGGTDRVLTSVSYTLSAGASVELFTTTASGGFAALKLTGNELGQTIQGNIGANTLNGGGGADQLYGFSGNDIYVVDTGADKVFEAAGAGADWVLTSASYALSTGQSVEKLSTTSNVGTTAMNLTGNELGQQIVGNAGANIINGKAGTDTLFGLAGTDSFVFDTALGAANVDRIGDFSHADDTIRLDRTIFTALTVGTLSAAAFKDLGDPGAVVDASDRILYNHNSGVLSYDQDGAGGAAAITFAILANKPLDLSNLDFLVVA